MEFMPREECRNINEKVWEAITHNKDAVNGKFNQILVWTITVLLVLVGSFGGTLWMQIATKNELTDKVRLMTEARAVHQGISQDNKDELIEVLNDLKQIQRDLKVNRVKK